MRKDQSVLSARNAALRMGPTECIERAASPQALLSPPGLALLREAVDPRRGPVLLFYQRAGRLELAIGELARVGREFR